MRLKISLIWLAITMLNLAIVQGQLKSNIKVSKLRLSEPIKSIGRSGGITIDQLGYLYVANFMNDVYRVSETGDVDLLSGGLYGAAGNVIDQEGNLIQSNFYGNTIVKINRDGEKEIFAKNLIGPVGLFINKKNEVVVCNCKNNSVVKISAEKKIEYLAYGKLFFCPNGIASDEKGNMYVVNFNNENIVKIPVEGEPSILAKVGKGYGNAHIAVYKNNLFVANINENQIFRVSLDGNVKLIAGDGSDINNIKDNEKIIYRPNGIAVDPKGNLYITRINGKWRGKTKSTIEIVKLEFEN